MLVGRSMGTSESMRYAFFEVGDAAALVTKNLFLHLMERKGAR